jgi:hypothetical protein
LVPDQARPREVRRGKIVDERGAYLVVEKLRL